jgi:membrane-associated phospholipid phosphatase
MLMSRNAKDSQQALGAGGLGSRTGILPPSTVVTAVLVGLVAVCAADLPVVDLTRDVPKTIEIRDWFRLFRGIGYVPTWLIVALVMFLVYGEKSPASDGGPSGLARALFLASSALGGGLAALLLKIVFRRLRQSEADGMWYVLRPLTERPLDAGGLSMPSEHAAVAFAAAFAMCILIPQGRWVWLALAIGCGVTRILQHAHYASDVYVSALVAWLVVRKLTKLILTPGQPLASGVS